MNTFTIVFVVLFVIWLIGRIYIAAQDKNELKRNPNHPIRFSAKDYPIGSGVCPVRNGDRHIWDYGYFKENIGPTTRFCKHCGKEEYKRLTDGWNSSAW